MATNDSEYPTTTINHVLTSEDGGQAWSDLTVGNQTVPVYFENGIPYECDMPYGQQGADGIQGLKGTVGAQGPQGFQGATGPRGTQGLQGQVGPQG